MHFTNDVTRTDYAPQFSKEKLFKPSMLDLKLCGLGTGIQGCKGARTNGFVVLTNDWALDNPRPHYGPRGGPGVKNYEYWNVGASVHASFSGPGLASKVIRSTMAFFAEDALDFGSDNPTPSAAGNGSASFKLMYRGLSPQPLSRHPEARGGALRGPLSAHTTPVDDDEPSTTRFISGGAMGAQRANGKYLGVTDSNYNAGWNAED